MHSDYWSLGAIVVNTGNNIASVSNENSPERCGERCDNIVNCNSFVVCTEPNGLYTCHPKDKILDGREMLNKPSNCASYKKMLGKYSLA